MSEEHSEGNIPFAIDPALDRADKVVELLQLKESGLLKSDESHTVLNILIRGLIQPFIPPVKVVGTEDNVVHIGR